MNVVDTANGRRDVTKPGWQRPTALGTKPVADLEPGDVIAVPFAGYGDILCAIETIEPGDNHGTVIIAASDGQYAYDTILTTDGGATVAVYPADQKGKVQR